MGQRSHWWPREASSTSTVDSAASSRCANRLLGIAGVQLPEGSRQVDADLVQFLHDEVCCFLDAGLRGLDVHLRAIWGLIGRIHPCEAFDLALGYLLVEALGIALLYHRERRVDENLHEGQGGVLVDLPGVLAVALVGGDEPADDDGAGLGKQLRDLGNAANPM